MAKRSKDGRRRRAFRPAAPLEIPLPTHLEYVTHTVRMPVAQAAALCGRSVRTVARWRAASIDDPACLALLQVHAYGLLPGQCWQRWHVTPNGALALWLPTRAHPPVTVGQLEHVAGAYALAQACREELVRLRGQFGALRATARDETAANEPDGAIPRQFALL